MFDSISIAGYAAGLAVLIGLKALFWVYPQFKTPRTRMAAQLGLLGLFMLLYALLLAYFLDFFGMLPAYGPALTAGLLVLLIQGCLVLVNYFTRSKHPLTERQKSELLDL